VIFSLVKNNLQRFINRLLITAIAVVALAACQSNPVAVDPLVNQNQDLMDEIAQIEAEKNSLLNKVQELEQTLEETNQCN